MKVKLNKNTQIEFPCLMKTDLGQIVLVRPDDFIINPSTEYSCSVVYDETNESNVFIGTNWVVSDISKYTFLPKGYKITIKN